MERDLKKYPKNDNGEALWNMKENGDDLSKKREINFSVIFPTEEKALRFAVTMLLAEQKVSLKKYESNTTMPWQVDVHAIMLPTHENITNYENLLALEAEKLSGENDGWGCFARK